MYLFLSGTRQHSTVFATRASAGGLRESLCPAIITAPKPRPSPSQSRARDWLRKNGDLLRPLFPRGGFALGRRPRLELLDGGAEGIFGLQRPPVRQRRPSGLGKLFKQGVMDVRSQNFKVLNTSLTTNLQQAWSYAIRRSCEGRRRRLWSPLSSRV